MLKYFSQSSIKIFYLQPTLYFVINNFKNTPAVKSFSNLQCLGTDETEIAENAIHYHKKKNITDTLEIL